ERQAARQGEEAHHAERVQVAARVDRPAHGLLRAHELRRPHHPPWVRAAAAVHACDAEVRNQRPPAPELDQDVVRFHVAMHYAVRMGVVERARHLLEHARSTTPMRSEEHTSELQSPYELVCRLLLEKKKTPTARAALSTAP